MTLDSVYHAVSDATESSLVHSATAALKLTGKEIAGRREFSVPFRDRLWLWANGFLSQAAIIYDFEKHGVSDYLSDFQRERSAWINGQWAVALDNKLLFHWMLQPFDDHRTATYGLIDGGRFHSIDVPETATEPPISTVPSSAAIAPTDSDESRDAADWVCDRLDEDRRLVVKPVSSGGGKDVEVVTVEDGAYHVSGDQRSSGSFRDYLANLENALVTEYVSQASYAAELYPDVTNTIRVVTMWDDVHEEPFIPCAVHRIGTSKSAPVDNWSRGGLSAAVDVETGKLGPGIQYPYSGALVEHVEHPDTRARIQGAMVPSWDSIRARLLEIARTYSHIPYVGWDIVVIGGGSKFKILEANNCTDVDLLQIHRPLLVDRRTHTFYERHGVI